MPSGGQVIEGALGPLLAQGEVIVLGSALVAMAFDQDLDRPELLQPGRVPVEDGLGVLADEVLVVVEVDHRQGLFLVDLLERLGHEDLFFAEDGLLDDGLLDLLDLGLFLDLGRRGNFLDLLLAAGEESDDEHEGERVNE